MEGKAVDILLATYNGEAFVEQQIESLLSQSYKNWRLFVRDDNSQDRTKEILKEYVDRYPDQIELLDIDGERTGACQGFGRLIDVSKAEYAMFCDQDDVWAPEKIEVTLEEMRRCERKFGKELPILVHSDLKVVDRDLNPIADSFRHYQNIPVRPCQSLNRFLLQNVVTGCATMINAALRDLGRPIPEGAIIHDWWFAMVAAAFGRIQHLDKCPILYRQHGKNEVGAKGWGWRYIAGKVKEYASGDSMRASLRRTQLQAGIFAEKFADRLSPAQVEMLSGYARLSELGFWQRRRFVLRHGVLKIGFLRNAGLLASL